MSNVNDFITALNTLSERNSFEIYIPSLKKNIAFKPLTTGQQRSLYLCVADDIIYRTKFILTTFDIIKESCVDQSVISSFTTIDRTAILLSMRKNTLGSNLVIENNDKQYITNFDSSLELIKTLETPANKIVSIKDIQIELHTPLLVDQYGLEKELRSDLPEALIPDEAIKELILNEASKLIKEIIIENKPVNYSSLSYKERLMLVERLPAEFMYEMQTYAEAINTIQTDLLTVKADEETNITFDLTVDFFLDR